MNIFIVENKVFLRDYIPAYAYVQIAIFAYT